jgi:hypothetical protein
MTAETRAQSIPEIAEVLRVQSSERRDAPPAVLIEVPHGATTVEDWNALRRRLCGSYPEDLVEFFWVNTDVGAPEVARAIAEELRRGGLGALVVRGLVPRTFVDCNRRLDTAPPSLAESRLTPGIPAYVTDPRDVALLRERHAAYTREAERAYGEVCGAGGLALILHTYAPRSVEIDEVDGGIVAALRQAYAPERWVRFVERPPVDMITRGSDGAALAAESLVRGARARLEAAGFEVADSATYTLHAATMGFAHATRWPGSVLCVELRRDLLAAPFRPFEPMRVPVARALAFARPLAAAFAAELEARRRSA